MKVAILGSFPPLRGISSYCFELTKALVINGVTLTFNSFKSMYPKFLYPGRDLKEDHTFPEFSHPTLAVKKKLTWYNPLGWIIESLKCNATILHCQWWSLPLAPIFFCWCVIFKLQHKPVIFTVHNVLAHDQSLFFFYVSKLLFSFGDHFIVHSNKNKQQLIAYYGIDPHKITLIPHGPLNLQTAPNASPEAIRKEFGFTPNNKVILLFGAIRPYKGVETAIVSFSHVAKRFPEARLMIVGKLWQDWKPFEERILRNGIEDKVVTCLDYIPSGEVHRYFLASDLVLLPYHHFDSQSGVGGTAISFRKPMIVTKTGGLPDLVLDDRVIIPPNDPDALSSAIIQCLDDPCLLMKLSHDADMINQTLSWEGIARQTIQAYEHLIP